MECFNFERVLALVDKEGRKTKNGITMAIVDLEEGGFPNFCHFRNMDALLTEMIPRLSLDRENIIETASEFLKLSPREWKMLVESEELLDAALKKLEPSDFEVFEKQDPSCEKCLRWVSLLEKYCFMNKEDLKQFVPALQKKAHEILQEELIDREETRK